MKHQFLFLISVILFSFIFLGCQHDNHKNKVSLITTHKEDTNLSLENIYSGEEEEEIIVPFKEMSSEEIEKHFPSGVEFSERVPHLWPVKDNTGYISSWFGSARSKGGGASKVHQGIDIIIPMGTPVLATADGTVRLAESRRGYGLLVVVQHEEDIYSAYAHLSKILVKVGDEVRSGDVIGLSGATGRVTTAHLHYEVRKGEKAINPLWFLPAVEE